MHIHSSTLPAAAADEAVEGREPNRFRTTRNGVPVPLDQLRDGVLIPRAIFEDSRLRAMDTIILIYLHLQPRGAWLSHRSLVQGMRECGWTSGNGRRIGKDAVYGSVNRLIAAGYLTRHQTRGPDGCMGPVEFTLHHKLTTDDPDDADSRNLDAPTAVSSPA